MSQSPSSRSDAGAPHSKQHDIDDLPNFQPLTDEVQRHEAQISCVDPQDPITGRPVVTESHLSFSGKSEIAPDYIRNLTIDNHPPQQRPHCKGGLASL